ncbi:S1 domain-containing post-transcriptional regulator GSP13 [Tenuibacillus multivorans]|uniref:General stress protein 13 n=1 Tax=Tenuibacillus multivorans TaxID=237069 RepID=A0A1H0FRZ9_9BACI|nr:S1 domain-containing post-transcriptional regulator GSP13 [Tenuibacillus multivorans]GEL77911.1 general stress protein 13 [Tenuibacillus multivorans]SDN97321.1 general stress protein 13 [Tenuibacillus multivorans]
MSKIIEEGQVVEGKVKGIQPYGAFVEIDQDVQGLVHISEITHGYVKDIQDHLSVGDDVKVKVLNIDENQGKYSLSIRATIEKPSMKKPVRTKNETSEEGTGFNVLKDKLEEWIEQSKDREQTYRN